MSRGNGILLHISSLPGEYGIGTMGIEAYTFIDNLKNAGQKYWQILPCSPTGYGDSPYQGLSAFAGNPNFIDPDLLIKDGLLGKKDVEGCDFSTKKVDYAAQYPFRRYIFNKAYKKGVKKFNKEFSEYKYANAHWLFDFSMFVALRESFGLKYFKHWDAEYLNRDQATLTKFAQEHEKDIECIQFIQFLYDKQWQELKAYANENGIKIIGDIPIYVSPDSAELWAQGEMFLQDGSVAGTPPDYYCEDGQMWGNPLYDWEQMRGRGYDWWISRIEHCLKQYDIVRIDHFRGLESYFSIPEGKMPKDGKWEKGPGKALIDALKNKFHNLPVIAEDLGFLTPEVYDLLAYSGFAGTKVLHFGFSEENSTYMPHNFKNHCVCYTGTHDNNTTKGFYAESSKEEKERMQQYIGGVTSENIADKLIKLGMMSVADISIIPMQDILNLGKIARMNYPSKVMGNWKWRMEKGAFTKEKQEYLCLLTKLYGR